MYKQEPLEYQSLEPFISDITLDIHYNKHYLGYLNKLNNLLEKVGYKGNLSKEEMVKKIDIFNIKDRGEILYNLGGVLNHELYFKTMSDKKNNLPVGKIKQAIEKEYGSFENFKMEFIKTSKELVGSGYTFLVINSQKKLDIINLPNQDTPYMFDLIPIAALDLWEHAYYLDYQNRRDEYINNFFSIIDFEKINEIYQKNI